mmetsp:Transcript_67709/g.192136  ORF Transcript_67709/g.192136 Transcript_67709/m.192136 type:complete len:221 (+) Transcript_67709:2340-3002(+)
MRARYAAVSLAGQAEGTSSVEARRLGQSSSGADRMSPSRKGSHRPTQMGVSALARAQASVRWSPPCAQAAVSLGQPRAPVAHELRDWDSTTRAPRGQGASVARDPRHRGVTKAPPMAFDSATSSAPSVQPYSLPRRRDVANSAKMRRKRQATITRVKRSGRDAKMVCTTTFRFSLREMTRSGLRARRMRSVFTGPELPARKYTTETETTVPSSQFQPLCR